MAEGTIDELVIEVSSDAGKAAGGFTRLVTSLTKLERAIDGPTAKLTRLADSVRRLSNSISGLNAQKLLQLNGVKVANGLEDKLGGLAHGIEAIPADSQTKIDSLAGLSTLNGLSASKTLGENLKGLATAVGTIPDDAYVRLSGLSALSALSDVKISSTLPKNIRAIGEAVQALPESTAERLRSVADALAGFKALDGVKITAFINGIKKLPEAMKNFEGLDVDLFAEAMAKLNAQLVPMAKSIRDLADSIKELPPSFRTAGKSAGTVTSANKQLEKQLEATGKKAETLGDRLKKLFNTAAILAAVRTVVSKLGEAVSAVSDYVEDMNLYAASMGDFAEAGAKFAMDVQTKMGIDSGEWMRFQGVLQSIGTGFGIAGDRMAVMSQNMTQLGYDLASFYNLDIDEAMRKVQSGFAGELEPMRRIGYDLSVARMEIEATNLGIEKQVSDMSQAEKAALRYHLIMTQLTQTHGDMARTINSPANQLRVLRAQLTLAARAIGNILIPMLNMILPYAIAAAKAIQMLAQTIARFFGIDATFEVDYSSLDTSGIGSGIDTTGLDDLGDSAGDAGDAVEDTREKVDQLKRSVMGFDELNKLTDNSDADSESGRGGGAGVSGGGVDGSVLDQIPMDTYDFMKGLDDYLTEVTDKLADKFMRLLPLIAAIGAGLAGWKIADALLPDTIKGIERFKKLAGVALAAAGAVIYLHGVWDAWTNGMDLDNLLQMLVGMAGVIGGLGLAFGPVAAGIGAIVTGLGLFVTSLHDVLENGVNAFNQIGMAVGTLATAIGTHLAGLPPVVSGIVLAIGGATQAVVTFLDAWNNGLGVTNIAGYLVGIAEAAVGIGIAVNPVAGIITGIVGLFGLGVLSLREMITEGQNWANSIGAAISGIAEGSLGLLISEFAKFGAGEGSVLCDVFANIEKLGGPFPGLVSKVMEFAGQWAPVLEVLGKVASVLGAIISVIDLVMSIKEVFNAVTTGGRIANQTIFSLVTSIMGIGLAVSAVVGWPALVVAAVVAAVAAIGSAVYNNWEAICDFFAGIPEWFETNVVQPVQGFFAGIAPFFEELWNTVVTGIDSWWSGVAQWMQDNVIQPIMDFWNPIAEWFSQLWASVSATAQAVWHNIGVFVNGIWLIIQRAWEVASDWFDQNVLQPIAGFFTEKWEAIQKTVGDAWETVKGKWGEAWGWFDQNVIQPITRGFTDAWNEAVRRAQEAWNGITGAFAQFGSWFGGIVSDAWREIKAAFEWGGRIFEGVVDAITSAFKWVMNEFISGLNWAIAQPFNGLNSILAAMRGWEILGIRPFEGFWDVPVPQIPYLASGGQVTSGQLFVARENGVTEMVGQMGGKATVANNQQIVEGISQGVANAMFRVLATQQASDGGETVIEIPIYINRDELTRAVYKGNLNGVRRGVMSPQFV